MSRWFSELPPGFCDPSRKGGGFPSLQLHLIPPLVPRSLYVELGMLNSQPPGGWNWGEGENTSRNLGGWFQPNPFEQFLVKLDYFCRDRGENKQAFEVSPPRHANYEAFFKGKIQESWDCLRKVMRNCMWLQLFFYFRLFGHRIVASGEQIQRYLAVSWNSGMPRKSSSCVHRSPENTISPTIPFSATCLTHRLPKAHAKIFKKTPSTLWTLSADSIHPHSKERIIYPNL